MLTLRRADGSTPLHQAVQEKHVGMIRALAAAGGKLDAVNKDNLTPLLLAEAPEKPNPADMGDLDVYKPKRNSKEEVVAALRELMHLGPNDPAPQPPPLPAADKDKKVGADKETDKEKKDVPKQPRWLPRNENPEEHGKENRNHSGVGMLRYCFAADRANWESHGASSPCSDRAG